MLRGNILLLGLILMSWIPIHGQVMKKMTREDYIDAYKNMAIAEMHRSGVPASITLSQGMLESDNGNSRLARKGNNHFGIKCHNGWKGGKIYHDDDERKECFRKYDSVYESYEDHSDFLRGSTRYAFLFELNPADYEGWAKGLKKAGYATNPSYSSLLVKIIEENQLHQYDLTGDLPSWRSEKAKKSEISFNDQAQEGRIMQRNRIKYIVVQENETYESLRKEFSLMSFEIFKYNDLTPDSLLYEGRELYLQPKRNRAAAGKEYHILKIGETIYTVSQLYGVKTSSLYKRNNLEPGTEPKAGTKILLRKKARMEKIVKPGGKIETRHKAKPAEKVSEEEAEFEFKF